MILNSLDLYIFIQYSNYHTWLLCRCRSIINMKTPSTGYENNILKTYNTPAECVYVEYNIITHKIPYTISRSSISRGLS